MPTFIVTPSTELDGYDRIDIHLSNVRIGNIRCRFMGEKVVIYNAQIFPEFQRNGYGRKAIVYLRRRFSTLIADRVRVPVRPRPS